MSLASAPPVSAVPTQNAVSPNDTNQNDSYLGPTPKKEGEYLVLRDLISPNDLVGRQLGKDYVLLALFNIPGHGGAKNILSKGLKSLATLASAPNASERTKKALAIGSDKSSFGFDLTKLHFLLVGLGAAEEKVVNDSVVIAAHPDSVNIFHQLWRQSLGHRSYFQGRYMASSMSAPQYLQLQNTLPPAYCLNQNGSPVLTTMLDARGDIFTPEAVVDASMIRPDMFVPHSMIDPTLRGVTC